MWSLLNRYQCLFLLSIAVIYFGERNKESYCSWTVPFCFPWAVLNTAVNFFQFLLSCLSARFSNIDLVLSSGKVRCGEFWQVWRPTHLNVLVTRLTGWKHQLVFLGRYKLSLLYSAILSHISVCISLHAYLLLFHASWFFFWSSVAIKARLSRTGQLCSCQISY